MDPPLDHVDAQPADASVTLEHVLHRRRGVFRPADVEPWLSCTDIRREVAEGRWTRPHHSVYLAHNAKLTDEQARWVCLLSAPPGSALGGLTAAGLDGFTGFAVTQNQLVIPPGFAKPRRTGLASYDSTQPSTADVHPLREPRRTRLPRGLVDAASWSESERRARAIVLAGMQQRVVRPSDLRDALSRRGRCKHHALITESIDAAEGGDASVPEHDFELIRRQFRLPPSGRQVRVRRADGRYYLDIDWGESTLRSKSTAPSICPSRSGTPTSIGTPNSPQVGEQYCSSRRTP